MEIMTTVEVRWFFPGEIPPRVLAWYRMGERDPEQQPVRVDHYLPVLGTDGLGLKYREARIEMKQRYERHADRDLGDGVAGNVELWTKWSFTLAEERIAERFEDLDAWVAVQKARHMRNYEIKTNGTLVAIPVDVTPRLGCSVELTRVVARGSAWWTLAFEAVGAEEALMTTLERVAGHVLTHAEGFGLTSAVSYGYPRWLLTFAGSEKVS
ncbi:MAG: hypothetical protein ACP5JG_09810 [Anaerolineae bacterium]